MENIENMENIQHILEEKEQVIHIIHPARLNARDIMMTFLIIVAVLIFAWVKQENSHPSSFSHPISFIDMTKILILVLLANIIFSVLRANYRARHLYYIFTNHRIIRYYKKTILSIDCHYLVAAEIRGRLTINSKQIDINQYQRRFVTIILTEQKPISFTASTMTRFQQYKLYRQVFKTRRQIVLNEIDAHWLPLLSAYLQQYTPITLGSSYVNYALAQINKNRSKK